MTEIEKSICSVHDVVARLDQRTTPLERRLRNALPPSLFTDPTDRELFILCRVVNANWIDRYL